MPHKSPVKDAINWRALHARLADELIQDREYTSQQIATMLGVTIGSANKWLGDGQIRGYRRKAHVRFSPWRAKGKAVLSFIVTERSRRGWNSPESAEEQAA